MDFSWASYFNGFWIFPLLCLLFMAIMMIACGAMLFRCGHGARSGDRSETARPNSGEIGKEQYDGMRGELNG